MFLGIKIFIGSSNRKPTRRRTSRSGEDLRGNNPADMLTVKMRPLRANAEKLSGTSNLHDHSRIRDEKQQSSLPLEQLILQIVINTVFMCFMSSTAAELPIIANQSP